ncbi:unnamed protein product [Schistosoma margrebowiei]|uniref:Uncharacterized protein n=1 Tax=Schistosoma margrebowiei TaxID=48269 RepID=A0A3P7YH43_9TREM|nr:unnamed protein product [Schistosoma margrebowiei]
MAILLLVWIIYDIVIETIRHFDHSEYSWITYGTNWTFLILTITHISLAIYCLIYNIKCKYFYFYNEITFKSYIYKSQLL